MTPARSLLIAVMAVALLIGAQPMAGDEQFPRGLMASAAPRAPNQSCTIETRSLSFGTYDPLAGTELDAIGQITYTCEKGGNVGTTSSDNDNKAIRIEMAQGTSNSFQRRGMVGPEFLVSTRLLEYNIYLDATHSTVWGTGEGSTQYYYDAKPPNRTPVTVPAFGRIFRNQDVQAGPYTDNVPVRILF